MILGLFCAGPAVLPPWRRCGLGWRRRRGRGRHWVRGEGPPDCVACRSWGWWGRAKHVHYQPGGLWLRPPSKPAGGIVAAAGRRATGPAGPGWGCLPPRRSARGATSPWRCPILGNPTGRGPRPRAPRRSGGTRSWPACRGPTPGPPSTWPRPGGRAGVTSPAPWGPPAAPRGRPGQPPRRPAHRR